MKIHKNSVVAIITFSIILLIILAIILPKFPIFVVKRTFNYATQNIVNISGLSHWLVKGILVFVLIPFYPSCQKTPGF
jgi:type II secretory pathway component PulF